MTRRPLVVSLCSGIGGLDLGLEWAGWRLAAQVELDPFCRAILAHHWPGVPRHDDIATFPAWWQSQARPQVDLVCAGFPCQPVSAAGKRKAQADPRWLWPQVARCVRLLRPRLVLLENVPGLLARGLGEVLGDLAHLGYDAQWDCLSAANVGAPHLRRRVFILAHLADPDRVQVEEPHQPPPNGQASPRRDHPAGRGQAVADPSGPRRQGDLPGHGAGSHWQGRPRPDHRSGGTMADPDSGRRRPAKPGLSARQPDPGRGGALADPQGQRHPSGPPPTPGPGRPPGGGAVADPHSSQPQRPRDAGELPAAPAQGTGQGPQRQRDGHPAGGRGAAVANPDHGRRAQRPRAHPDRRGHGEPAHHSRQRTAQPGMGGGTDGPAGGLDRPAAGLEGAEGFPGWPGPPGHPQQHWEPPRTIAGRQPHRTRRLAALGNAVVPQVAEIAGRWAMSVLDQLDHGQPCTPAWPFVEGAQS